MIQLENIIIIYRLHKSI
nr:translational initiation factor 1 [Acicarpha tribuloides]WOX61460.1 translational initiation factor 1 [Acicarpha tribuloides]